METSQQTEAATVVAGFARRVATRDVPPPRPADFFEPTVVQGRIEVALRRRVGIRRVERVRNLSRLCYALMQMPSLNGPELEILLEVGTVTVGRLTRQLRTAGLLTVSETGWPRDYSLSRAGEDWLLPVVDPDGAAAAGAAG
jgi:hypothetical protein